LAGAFVSPDVGRHPTVTAAGHCGDSDASGLTGYFFFKSSFFKFNSLASQIKPKTLEFQAPLVLALHNLELSGL
jgi:hypothetical protein